jgi:hypothetical protein
MKSRFGFSVILLLGLGCLTLGCAIIGVGIRKKNRVWDGRPAVMPVTGKVYLTDMFNPTRSVKVELDASGRVVVADLLPGAYVVKTAAGSAEFLLNRDEQLSLDVESGIAPRLGVDPIIDGVKLKMPQP